jgi:hypothetical protein
LENASLKNLSNQQYNIELAEKCRKALEVSFGEISMPNCYSKRKVVSKVKTVGKRKAISKRKIVIKRRTIKNARKQNLPIFF